MRDVLRRHWPEYLLEAVGLGFFMLAASGFAVLLFHPASPFGTGDPLVRRALMGLAMGTTPVSGMSMNPARTVASAAPSGIWTAWWLYRCGYGKATS